MEDKEIIEEIKQDFKMHEEKHKQIEEIAHIIENAFKVYFGANDLVDPEDFPYQAKDLVKELIEHYQVVDKDSVVLSREEAERLSSSHDIIFCDNKDCSNNILCRCAEISECPKNIPEYNEKLSVNQHKLDLFQKLCKERERANGWEDRYSLLQKELKNKGKETVEKLIAKIKQFLSNVETVVEDDKYSLYPEIGYKCSEVDDFIDELANNSMSVED